MSKFSDFIRTIDLKMGYNHEIRTLEIKPGHEWPDENEESFVLFLGGHPCCGGVHYQGKEKDGRRQIRISGCD